MRSLFLAVLLCSIHMQAWSRGHNTPGDSLQNFWMIRGKALAYPLGNGAGTNYSLGFEYLFHKRHGIGIDLAYNDLSSFRDPVKDSSTGEEHVPPGDFSVWRGALVSYRYYLWFHDGAKSRYRPYLSAFTRWGNADWHPQEGFVNPNPALRDRLKRDQQEYSAGLLLGFISDYRLGGLNLDLNMGPFQKWTRSEDVRLENGVAVTHVDHTQCFGWRIGLTVDYLIRRK